MDKIDIIMLVILEPNTSTQIFSIFWNILGGIISGVIVYFVIEYKEKMQWKKSKNKLVNLLNDALSRSLTTIRLLINIKPPLDIQNDEQFIKYIKQEFGDNCEKLLEKIKSGLTKEKHKILLSNIQGLQEEIKYLLSIFLSFRKADKWYIKNILEMHSRMQSAFWIFYAFPEISNIKYQNDKKIEFFKKSGANDIMKFCKFILKFKCDKRIKAIEKNYKKY
ncbi:hypothetical protein KAS41_04795 [Candidatus Parcubacteria bacterium]|nr:hypothetical protein [Candidatus Parcubacteria bacterium]